MSRLRLSQTPAVFFSKKRFRQKLFAFISVASICSAVPTTTEKYYSHLLKLLPVTEPVYGEGSAAVWTVTDPNHPILAGLPAQWSDGAGFSFVVAKSNATVLVQNTNGVPLVTVSEAAGGTVVHLNHDMTYTITALGPEIRQLIVNAVTFAGHLQSAIRLSLVKPAGVTGNPMRLQFTPSPGYDYTVQYRDGLGAEFEWHDL